MTNNVLAGYVTRIFGIYIDDVLNHGSTDDECIDNTRKMPDNPAKTRLGLKEVEYVRHLISSEGTSFTPAKRLEVLDFPLPANEKALLHLIGLVNYFRDHVPKMTEMVKTRRALVDVKKYKRTKQQYPTVRSYISWRTTRHRSFKPLGN